MKRFLPLFLVLLPFFAAAQSGEQTYIPDDNFEQALINLGYDDVLDDYVLTSNINTVTELNLNRIHDGKTSLFDLTGIEDFIALKSLDCGNNSVRFTLDISQMSQLEELNVSNTFIGNLDTSNNPELRKLFTGHIFGTGGPVLNLSENPKLEQLSAGGPVDLSNNPALRTLSFTENSLSTLDVSNNPELQYLNITENPAIKELDLSNNPKLESLHASRMYDLRFINLKNGNNQTLITLNVNINGCVQVDDIAYAEAQTNWNIGDGSYSDNCEGLTYVPNDNFEQALIDRGFDDELDDFVLTANINTATELNISNLQIEGTFDLTGIEDFTALKILDCSNITDSFFALDTSNMSQLEELNVFDSFF